MTLNDLARAWCQTHPWTVGYILAVFVLELILMAVLNWTR